MSTDVPGWEGSIGPFPGQYGRPHVYARDVHSGAGNCVCGRALFSAPLHVQAAPGVPLPNLATDRACEEALQEAGRLRARVEELEALEELPHPPAVEIRRPHDEAIEIWVDGEEIASANHDEHGWSGMAAVEKLTVRLARAFGVEMLETHGAGDDPACRVCGCTDDEACDGGCSWVDAGDPADERGPLCSSREDPE